MKKKALCVIGLLLLTGCGNSETATTAASATAEIVTTAEQKTEATTAETKTTTNVKPKLSDREAKNQDAYTAGRLCTIFNYGLADEKGFDDFYPLAGKDGIAIKPESDGSYTYYIPEGIDLTNLLAVMNEKIDFPLDFNYSTDTMKPDKWLLCTDEDFNVYLYILAEDGKAYELYPNMDQLYK